MTTLYFIEAKDPRLAPSPQGPWLEFLGILSENQGTAFLGDFDDTHGAELGRYLSVSATLKPLLRLPQNGFEGLLFLSHLDEITWSIFKAQVKAHQGFNLIVTLSEDQGDIFGFLFRFKEGHNLLIRLTPMRNLLLKHYLRTLLLIPGKAIRVLSPRQQRELSIFSSTTEWQAFYGSLEPEQEGFLREVFLGEREPSFREDDALYPRQWAALRDALRTEAGFSFRNGLTPLEWFFFSSLLAQFDGCITLREMDLEQGLLLLEEIPLVLQPEVDDIQKLQEFTPSRLFPFYLLKPGSPLHRVVTKAELTDPKQRKLLAAIYTLCDSFLILYLFFLNQNLRKLSPEPEPEPQPEPAAALLAIARGLPKEDPKELEA